LGAGYVCALFEQPQMTQAPDSPISRWSTDNVASMDRFSYWRESLGVNLIGDTPRMPQADRDSFAGELTRIPIADTGVMRLCVSFNQLRTDRGAAEIRECPGDGIFLFRAQNYHMEFLFDDRAGVSAGPGMTVMGGLDRERYCVALEPGEHRCDVLRLPSASFRGVLDNATLLEPRGVEGATGADALLNGFFESFMRELPRLDSADRTNALATLTNLVILALRQDARHDEPVRDAVRAARLRAAQDYIARYAMSPVLSPASVAAALHVSTRQLHALFEPTGKSFSQHLAEQRIHRAVHAMLIAPTRPVAQIAFACGFESLSAFYRTFRVVTGKTPTELRAATPKH
jgi:AraC-like DNA-binding protein